MSYLSIHKNRSNLWVQIVAIEQLSLSSRLFCKVSGSLDFQIIQNRKPLILPSCLVTTFSFLFTVFSLLEEVFGKNLADLNKSEQLSIVGTKKLKNWLWLHFLSCISEFGLTIFTLRNRMSFRKLVRKNFTNLAQKFPPCRFSEGTLEKISVELTLVWTR